MLPNIYKQRITILNKHRRADNGTNSDIWHKYTIDDAVWYTDSSRSAGSSAVYIGTYIIILIPFHEDYLPYLEWRDSDLKETHFTINNGDYVVLGDVEEEVTANNIVNLISNYEPNVCQVRHLNQAYDRYGAFVQLKIEGV